MQAAQRVARSTGRPGRTAAGGSGAAPELDTLAVRTVSPYGTDMPHTLGAGGDSSQSHFDADQLEAMAGCAELINSGRSGDNDVLTDLATVQAFAGRYAFDGTPGEPADLSRLRRYRARLDEIARACEAGDLDNAIERLNALL